MPSIAAVAETAALVGDPARATMLAALMDGRALSAAELARVAGVTPQTASGHLARLAGAGLLDIARQGRLRFHRLASPTVAQMLEGIMAVAATNSGRKPIAIGPRDAAMRIARTCYDHLAGRLAVAMADAMVERGQIELGPDGGAVTPVGASFLHGFGLDFDVERAGRRMFCRPCLDWSDRRPHLAGAVGAALCSHCVGLGWVLADGGHARPVRDAGGLARAASDVRRVDRLGQRSLKRCSLPVSVRGREVRNSTTRGYL